MKKSNFKYQLEQALKNQNWEIVEIDASEKWWDDEHWKICSKHNHEFRFFICFIVDPMFEGERKKGQGIYEVKATSQFPENWNDDTFTIASFQINKGNFELNLETFIHEILGYLEPDEINSLEIKNDLTEQEYILKIIDGQLKIITELSYDFEIKPNCVNLMIEFRKNVDETQCFNNENYIDLVTANCQSLSNYLVNDKVIEFLLNFSKISCEVRDVYLENGLKSYISNFLAKNEFETNDYNQVLINDFLFDHFYNLAKEQLKSGGKSAFFEFLENIPDAHKKFTAMIMHSMKNALN